MAALVGATAVGKTAVALALAAGLGAEIVNADSLQVYRELDIGTAKPTSKLSGRWCPTTSSTWRTPRSLMTRPASAGKGGPSWTI